MGSRPAAPTRSRGPIEPVDPGQHLRDAPFGRQWRPSPTRQASHARLPVPATQGAQRGQSDVGAALLSAHCRAPTVAAKVRVPARKQVSVGPSWVASGLGSGARASTSPPLPVCTRRIFAERSVAVVAVFRGDE